MNFLYQFSLRLHQFWGGFFSMFKNFFFSNLAGLWLAGVVDHVGLYGSKVAKGYSAFQRRSCLYCIIKPFIYEYLIFAFIPDEFLRNSQNMGKNDENTPSWWARQAQVVRDICLKFGHYRHQNKGFKDKGLRFWCIFMKEMKLMITF